jgi:hypothetical protein
MSEANVGRSAGLSRLLLLLILLAAFALRTWELGSRSLWFDEGMEYWVATAPLAELPASVQRAIQDPPLYSLLLHFWMQVSHSEYHLRFLSVCASLLSIAGLIVLGRRVGGETAGVYAGILSALLPSEIRYAQEVGQYGLMVCLLTWTTFALFSAIHTNHLWRWVGWLLLATCATYSYYGAIFTVLIPLGVYVTGELMQGRWSRIMAPVASGFGYVLLIAPLVIIFLPQQLFRGPTAGALQPLSASPWLEVRRFPGETLQLLAFQFSGWPWTWLPVWLPAGLVLATLVLATLAAVRQVPVRRAVLALVVTTVGYYVASRWNLLPYGFRYGLILAPLLLPVMGVGLAGMRLFKWPGSLPVWSGRLLLLGLVAVMGLSLPHGAVRDRLLPPTTPTAWPEREEMRPVTAYWVDHRVPGEVTYVYYGAVPIFRYYLRLLGIDATPVPSTWFLDCWRSATPAYCQVETIYFGRGLRSLEPAEKGPAVVESLPPAFESGWLIFAHVYADEQELIVQALSREYEVEPRVVGKGAALYRVRRLGQ